MAQRPNSAPTNPSAIHGGADDQGALGNLSGSGLSQASIGTGNKPRVSVAGASARQTRPQKINPDYREAKMTYLTISTEDLAALALSSGSGSVALSAAAYFYNAAPSETASGGLVFAIAIALAAYVWFGGMIIRVRRRSGLTWWNIFGD